LPINLPAVDRFRQRGEQEELFLNELVGRAYGGTAAGPGEQLAARANLHFRIVEVVMMLMLPLLAVALAVPPKRSNSSLGIFLSIVIVVTYHKVNQYAEQMGSQGRVVPEVALWVPFVVFAAMILWMYHVLAHRPGGQPIGTLERSFSRLARSVRRMLPRQEMRA
jgi:lipopolysaccharide export system permease protein